MFGLALYSPINLIRSKRAGIAL